ncbi:hypothetical protein H6F93_02920 [Leptolyngbya sp. FACHB-671]|uniref:response regulator n=1 Tax=Cyanophyceae TaxID=3028117 RepID=UPI0016851C00|nr:MULTISPECIES: response regulator [Cyanophyceae]MBD2066485.1 hypothetical protein [Leptolyngbya sp. FACHB-671]
MGAITIGKTSQKGMELSSIACLGGFQIEIIALTANAKESDREQALAAGFQQHLAKPVEQNTLLQAVLEMAACGI